MSLNSQGPFSAVQDAEKDKLLEDLDGHVHVFPGNIASFLSIMVPSCAPGLPKPVSQCAFSKYNPLRGSKVRSYAGLLSGLKAAVSSFPDNKRLNFFPLHRKELPFPFPEFWPGHYTTTPDLAISFPGDTSAGFDWQNTASFIHVKGGRTDDPFEQCSDLPLDSEHGATIVQLAIGARALMAVHGHCAVFALGIYANTCRIIRFDHVRAVASPPFSLKHHPEYLQQFFWTLSHPHGPSTVGQSIVGCDPTVRRLTLGEQGWLGDSLRAAGHAAPSNLEMCRRVEVEGTCGDAAIFKAYFTVGFVTLDPQLISQAAIVWRAVEDPRGGATDSRHSALPEIDGNVVMILLKDSWRRLLQRSEQEFFERIESRIPECKRVRVSLPSCVVGCDLGDVELHRWAATSPCKLPDAIEAVREQLREDGCDSEPATMPAGSPPLPLQQTCTSHLIQGFEGLQNERTHMRFVTSTVGRPLTEFKDTRQLCQAVRDAIAAHKSLWNDARILHRDISVGSILIVDADLCQSDFVGLLHNFDHSSMVHGGVGRGASFESDRSVEYDTSYFMATELLESADTRHEVEHDLESFFWILLWVVLRHTKHKYPQGGEEYTTLLGAGPYADIDYGAWKRGYLFGFLDIFVWNNRPLSGLLRDFRLRCCRSLGGQFACMPRLMTHDHVLAIFDTALKEDEWPTGEDGPRPFVAPGETRTSSADEAGARSESKKRKQDAVATRVTRPEAEAGPHLRKRAKSGRKPVARAQLQA